MATFKEKIIALCKKHGVKYDKIRYYKESPYQKRRYRKEYIGEEVWLKVNGWNYVFNSIDHVDESGDIEPHFIGLFV